MTTNFNSIQVLARFALRILILAGFAASGNLGFGRSFAALLLLSVVPCVVIALVRQEYLFAPRLTDWDEGAAYGLLYALTVAIGRASA